MNIRKPTVQQYVYFLRSIDTLAGIQEMDSKIEKQIQSLQQFIKEKGEEKHSFKKRDYGDTIMVQVTYYCSSEREQLESFRQMYRELWTGIDQERFQKANYFLGQTFILCALTEEAGRTTAKNILDAWVNKSDEPHQVSNGCNINVGTIYHDTNEENIWILLYPKHAEETVGIFLDIQFPLIELQQHTCSGQIRLYEESHLPNIEELENELRRELETNKEPTTKFRELQRRVLSLSRLQQQYTEELGELERIQNTVEINIRNFKETTERSFKQDTYPFLYEELLDKYQRKLEQMGYDKRYFEVDNQRATIARETLQTLVDVERGMTERFITYLLFALGTVLAASQVIDADEKTTWVRLIIACAGLFLVGAGMLIYRKFRGRDLGKFLKETSEKSGFDR